MPKKTAIRGREKKVNEVEGHTIRQCIQRKSGNQGVHTKEVWEPGGAY